MQQDLETIIFVIDYMLKKITGQTEGGGHLSMSIPLNTPLAPSPGTDKKEGEFAWYVQNSFNFSREAEYNC